MAMHNTPKSNNAINEENQTLQNYLDGIISNSVQFDGPSQQNEAVVKIRDEEKNQKKNSPCAETTSEIKRRNSTSSESSSDSSSTYSIEISRTSPLVSFSSHAKKTRNKWKASEDLALLGVLLNYSHLLTFVEYFKPMKKFWIKISQVLNEQYGCERNARQCHDRFKVLFSKALRVQEDIEEDDTYSGTVSSEFKQLLLQVRNTFTFCNGNITLKAQPTVTAGHAPADDVPQSSSSPQLRQQQQQQQQQNQEPTEMERKETESMHSYIFHVLSNLQEQIDLLRNHLRATDRKTQELSDTLQTLISAVQYPPSVNFSETSIDVAENQDQTNRSHRPS